MRFEEQQNAFEASKRDQEQVTENLTKEKSEQESKLEHYRNLIDHMKKDAIEKRQVKAIDLKLVNGMNQMFEEKIQRLVLELSESGEMLKEKDALFHSSMQDMESRMMALRGSHQHRLSDLQIHAHSLQMKIERSLNAIEERLNELQSKRINLVRRLFLDCLEGVI